ncbi:branched-chain amino acid ABC transporter substrate-binding protein [Micromonospora pattaloongensis]|nr:branched-chain amino acid ABC transporter substrate-binding protein [Micromonospora pattaloongensis]
MVVRTRPRVGAVAVAVLVCAALAACVGGGDPRPVAPVIRLGTLVPLTGVNAPSGQAMVNAQHLAVNEANDAGGVLGRRVELVVQDDACDPGTAVIAAGNLIAQDITVSVGGYCSSATVPTLQIFRAAGVPMVIPLSNSAELLAPGYDSIFLICGTTQAEGRFAVAAMSRLGARRLAVVHDGTSFPVSLAESTVTAARAAAATGIRVVGQFELSQAAARYTRIAQRVQASGADTVYFTGYYAEANRLVMDLRTAGFTGKIVVGDGAVDGPLLHGLTEAQRRNLYGTTFIVPQFMPALADWSARFTRAVGHAPGPSAPEAYDAVTLALDAIRRAGSLDREAVRRAIAASADVPLLSGSPRFNPDGTRSNPTFLLLTARGDGFARVWSNDPA